MTDIICTERHVLLTSTRALSCLVRLQQRTTRYRLRVLLHGVCPERTKKHVGVMPRQRCSPYRNVAGNGTRWGGAKVAGRPPCGRPNPSHGHQRNAGRGTHNGARDTQNRRAPAHKTGKGTTESVTKDTGA